MFCWSCHRRRCMFWHGLTWSNFSFHVWWGFFLFFKVSSFHFFLSLFWKTGNYQRLPLAGKARAKIPSLFSVEDICIFFFHEEDSRHYDEHALLNKRFWSSILCGSAGKNMLVTLFSFPSCVFVFTNGSSYLYAVIFSNATVRAFFVFDKLRSIIVCIAFRLFHCLASLNLRFRVTIVCLSCALNSRKIQPERAGRVLNSSKGPKHTQSNGQWRFEKKHF